MPPIDPVSIAYFVVTIISTVASYIIAKRNGGTVPTPKLSDPVNPAPAIPDLIPGRPIVSAILRMVLAKLMNGVPLLAGESALLQQHSHLFTQFEPELRAMIDQLAKPAAPATPAK